MTKKKTIPQEMQDKILVYLFLKKSPEDLVELSGYDLKDIIKIKNKMKETDKCPLCNGSGHILCSDGQLVWCHCKKYRFRKKYLLPLGKLCKPSKEITKRIFQQDVTKNVCITGNLNPSEVKYIFSRMLIKANYPKYVNLTPNELLSIQFNDSIRYRTFTSNIRISVVLINGSVQEIVNRYSDDVLIQLISTRENRNLLVWTYLPYNKYNATYNYCSKNCEIIKFYDRLPINQDNPTQNFDVDDNEEYPRVVR